MAPFARAHTRVNGQDRAWRNEKFFLPVQNGVQILKLSHISLVPTFKVHMTRNFFPPFLVVQYT